MPRILIAQLFHESNGFVGGSTPLADFACRRGRALLEASGDGSALDGMIAGAQARRWELVPALALWAPPSAPAEDSVLAAFHAGLAEAVSQAGPLDGALLAMHGAMLCIADDAGDAGGSDGSDDPEGAVAERLRAHPALADRPIVGAFDLHGNPSARLAGALDAMCVYRRNPHDDLHETGLRAVAALARLVAARARGCCVRAHTGLRWPPSATATAEEPMAGLERLARAAEAADGEILEAAVFAGFPYADHGHLGVSICVSALASGRARAAAAARGIAADALANRARAVRANLGVDDLLSAVRAAPPGAVVVAEPSDNIGAGARGDGTGALRLLLAHLAHEACLATICDPQAVAACADAAVGSAVRIPLGGRGSRFDPGPLALDALLVARSDGRFRLADPAGPLAALQGQEVAMGPCVVLAHRGLRVLVTSRPTPPWDLGMWASQGIDPAQARVIVVKSAVAHRRAYAPIAAALLSVETPGPCPTDLGAIAYPRADAAAAAARQDPTGTA